MATLTWVSFPLTRVPASGCCMKRSHDPIELARFASSDRMNGRGCGTIGGRVQGDNWIREMIQTCDVTRFHCCGACICAFRWKSTRKLPAVKKHPALIGKRNEKSARCSVERGEHGRARARC